MTRCGWKLQESSMQEANDQKRQRVSSMPRVTRRTGHPPRLLLEAAVCRASTGWKRLGAVCCIAMPCHAMPCHATPCSSAGFVTVERCSAVNGDDDGQPAETAHVMRAEQSRAEQAAGGARERRAQGSQGNASRPETASGARVFRIVRRASVAAILHAKRRKLSSPGRPAQRLQ